MLRFQRGVATVAILAGFVCTGIAQAACQVEREGRFSGDNEKVRLARGQHLPASANLVVYRAPLAVNTDGAPNSYHPDDFLGQRLAINRIDNGITFSRRDRKPMSLAERKAIFERWRATGWVVPEGYRISWRNVIAADGSGKPCVFQQGEHAGYFGSSTALRNGLTGTSAGECQVHDQLDQRTLPAIVLRGGASSPQRRFGAKTGDLVLTVNPATGRNVAAIVGDTGDGKRIGEGSVALNMALLGRSEQPRTYAEAKRLDTAPQDIAVAILPATRLFHRERPYSASNLERRVDAWAVEQGYGSREGLAYAILACSDGL